MPSPAEVATQHYADQKRRTEALAILVRRLWRRVSVDDLDGSWAEVVDRLTLDLSAAQLGAARAGANYVPESLAAAGFDPAVVGAINPARWSGLASDGRRLDSLMFSSIVHTRSLLGTLGPRLAYKAGGKRLDMLTRTQVSDAARGAAGVAIATRPRVEWERMVSTPCCQRCAVLSGKRFKWNQGFLRHPRCDCRHVVVAESEPSGYDAKISADQVKDLTDAQRQAVSDGADLSQVINAHRAGSRSSSGMTTSEGSSRRGYARNATRSSPRLTPEAIYRLSATQEEAVRLLARNGYILGNIDTIARAAARLP